MLLVIHSLNVNNLFKKTFSQFFKNPGSVSPHADCKSNSVHR